MQSVKLGDFGWVTPADHRRVTLGDSWGVTLARRMTRVREKIAAARYWRGQARRRAGRIEEAKEDFGYVLLHFADSKYATHAQETLSRLTD